MKKLLLFSSLFLFPYYAFPQNITKRELKKIISKSYKITKSNSVSLKDLILVADNTDSTFFKSNTLKIYTERKSIRKNNFCRTIELSFFEKKKVSLLDCQVCKEPANCYVSNEKKIFAFEIVKENQGLFLTFNNKFENRKYIIGNTVRNKSNKIIEFTLSLR